MSFILTTSRSQLMLPSSIDDYVSSDKGDIHPQHRTARKSQKSEVRETVESGRIYICMQQNLRAYVTKFPSVCKFYCIRKEIFFILVTRNS